jgi:hypothetical protein
MTDTHCISYNFGCELRLSLLERSSLWPLWLFLAEEAVARGWINAYDARWVSPDRCHWVFQAVSLEARKEAIQEFVRFGRALQRLIPWTDLYEKGPNLMALKVTLDNTMLQIKLGTELEAMRQGIQGSEEDVGRLGIAMDGMCQLMGQALEQTRDYL